MKPERRGRRFEIKLTVAAALIFAATLLGMIANPGRPVYPVEEYPPLSAYPDAPLYAATRELPEREMKKLEETGLTGGEYGVPIARFGTTGELSPGGPDFILPEPANNRIERFYVVGSGKIDLRKSFDGALIGGAFQSLTAKTSPETPLYFVFYDHNAYAVIGGTAYCIAEECNAAAEYLPELRIPRDVVVACIEF